MKKLLDRILFYGILIPISLLPMWVLYIFADILTFFLHHIIRYRKNVIEENLKRSFPNKTSKEINVYKKEFYKHLSDIFIEALKMLTISKKNLLKRYKCLNPEILQDYYAKGQTIIMVSAHYNNWEYMVLSLSLHFNYHGVGVGKRMSNKTFEELMYRKRTRYSTEVCYNDNLKEVISKYEKNKTPCLYMLLADQSPNDTKKCFWTLFLNQDTPVIFGPEYLAKKYNYPVFFYKVDKVKRGYYSFEIIPIAMNPNKTSYSEITLKNLSILEGIILNDPSYWLWSHRRWKHQRAKEYNC